MVLAILGVTVMVWAGCLVPLMLFWRDAKRAPSGVSSLTVKFLLTVLLVYFPLNLAIALLVRALDFGDEVLLPASAFSAFVVTTLVYRRTHRRLVARERQ